jgi:glycosyltransferase involved in cell wall biosynthesis
MPSPSTSVALATYNGARFLGAQLASIAAQDTRPDELVVGDDQSTDETPALLARFQQDTGIPVRLTRNVQRLGSSANFAAILSRCQTDVILLCDQDDVWRSDRVSTSLRHLQANPRVGLVFSNATLISESGTAIAGTLWDRVFLREAERRKFAAGQGAEVLLKTNTVTGATVALRRSALPAALPIPAGWVHDAWLAFIIERVHGALPIDDTLLSYRLHQSQQVGVAGWSPREVFALLRRQDARYLHGEAANYRALGQRLDALGAQHHEVGDRVRAKAAFLDVRASGRESLAGCARCLAGSLVNGGYQRYGLGAKQALYDLAGGVDAALGRLTGR